MAKKEPRKKKFDADLPQEEIAKLRDDEIEEHLGQQRAQFVEVFVRTGNAKMSALAAGYSKTCAAKQGYLLTINGYCKELIKRKNNDIAKEIGISKTMLAEKYKNIAMSNIGDFHEDWHKRKEWKDISPDKLHAVKEIYNTTKEYIDESGEVVKTVDTKIKLEDQLKAGKQLEDLLGWNVREEIKGNTDEVEVDISKCSPEELATLAKYGIKFKIKE